MADDCLGLLPGFAGLDALVPRVLHIYVTGTSASAEPRTAATATTPFTRFPNCATMGAYGTNHHRHRDCWCLYVGISQSHQEKNAIGNYCLNIDCLPLTFAGIHALEPPVINVPVTETSALLKPRTTRSATTDSAGFVECATLWTHRRVSDS